LWVTDITQHRTWRTLGGCPAVIDVYSRRCVGWCIADHLRTEVVVDALDMARWSAVGVVARDANKLDIFVAGSDGKTYTAAWDRNVASGQWRGWWNILTGAIPAGGAITAVARDPNKLDIFIVSTDGGVYTAAWDQNVANEKRRGWWRIGTSLDRFDAPAHPYPPHYGAR
jgi:hypothetical protein